MLNHRIIRILAMPRCDVQDEFMRIWDASFTAVERRRHLRLSTLFVDA